MPQPQTRRAPKLRLPADLGCRTTLVLVVMARQRQAHQALNSVDAAGGTSASLRQGALRVGRFGESPHY